MAASRSPRPLVILLSVAMASACDRVTTVSPPPVLPGPLGDPIAGRVAFAEDCGSCHASRDGFDLAFFGFSDSTIVRRALMRVDTATALDIVAYIRSLSVTPAGTQFRPFQPGNELLPNDVAFAERVFGEDVWPRKLSTDDLLAINPRTQPVAVPFPIWSIEENNLDWMPEAPPDASVLDHDGGEPRAALETYYRSGSEAALVLAVSRLREADRDVRANAPCITEPRERLRAQECFELRRWTATLGGQFLLRAPEEGGLDRAVHDSWWDVGDVAWQSTLTSQPIEDAERIWAQWMYLGWAFEPARHASLDVGGGLMVLGLPRHATFQALRSQVARTRGSRQPYEDVASAARFAPEDWVFDAVRFGYEHLLERLDSGDRPQGDALGVAWNETLLAYQVAAARIDSGGDKKTLRSLRNKVLNELLD